MEERMTKRVYKLQEFPAHSGNVNCLTIGKKNCRLFLTGGDDHKVNLWSTGKPTALMSLSGHTSPVESVAFNSSEVLVLAGASAGSIKLWDLEETKMVRTLTGHKSNCSTVEFHPFGDFFASGALDANLKIWDIRKKECIHTYTGHSRGISTIKFSPDGRWVVSGGFDNIVKIWDLTAGKLIQDFKYHEGHISSIDFHPLEFLLATGSADKTVKFWDLESFELIGSTRPEVSSVCNIAFHPDGRTLFCGLEESLKIYSWEPVICHDALDIGWSKLSDLSIHDGKLLGCSFFQNSVGVWASDISLIEPYTVGVMSEENNCSEQKHDVQQSSKENAGNERRVGSTLRSTSPDYESKEIKTIYVDCEKPISSKRIGRINSTKSSVSSDSKESSNISKPRQGPTAGAQKTFVQTNTKSFIVPTIVPRDSPNGRVKTTPRKEFISNTRNGPTGPAKSLYERSFSTTIFDTETPSVVVESEAMEKVSHYKRAVNSTFSGRSLTNDEAKETIGEKHLDVKNVLDKLQNTSLHPTPSHHETVAVIRGRTRNLVERFERSDTLKSDKIPVSVVSPKTTQSTFMLGKQPQITKNEPKFASVDNSTEELMQNHDMFLSKQPQITKNEPKFASVDNSTEELMQNHDMFLSKQPQITKNEPKFASVDNSTEELMQNHDMFLSTLRGRLTKLQVLRHFWERNDIKGTIDAMRKLPDHSVLADVLSVLVEKMNILTLDTFQSLLPLLLGLLDSKTERHVIISLEMLLKLVAVFGPVVRTAISTRPAVGVNLHAEERIECCKQCNVQLQKIQKVLPDFIRRGGLLGKGAMELSLVMQQS
ncbi:katanin p80 WD40 repeat-containing subunit B1 homolog KTN80.4-like isoform X2 [Impatiens glandulifera]|uniref:katanin p80 WD40 repeat-containing subunit B1 homolog KTN80.4-like isoform X2 n=1 Tax=Impatiens glandulifera TaxID=253017 RepID=UPI001FB09F9E|nr:katanin p80 WD40 repeat-containing subunit B1 homolog KTN80.4-like isoform X2 [Impatiens glandulifera]